MNILAIDSVSSVASVAILNEEKLISTAYLNDLVKHSKRLMIMIDQSLNNAELNYSDIDYYALSIGPGSFTGIRIGLATLKGLAQATNKKIIGVSSLTTLAYNLAYSDALIIPFLDARRDQVYTAGFKSDGNGKIQRLCKDQAVDFEDFKANLLKQTGSILLLGDGLIRYQNELIYPNLIHVNNYLNTPNAASTAHYALNNLDKAEDFHLISPIYLRKSYAEENGSNRN